MEESRATQGIGMDYDYRATAAQAVVDRERYFNECIQRELKNNRSEVKSK
jgi:hypothetical protein